MTNTIRTARRDDIHRPGAIDPSEYRYLWSFSYPGTAMLTAMRTGLPQKEPIFAVSDAGVIVRIGTKEVTSPWGKLPFFEKANEASGCDICGARFLHGDAFQHVPTGEVVLIGNICADKMGLHAKRGDWTANQKRMAQLKKDAEYIKRREELKALRRADAMKLLEAHTGLEAALKIDHYLSRDLAAKLDQYGTLSEKQIALAFKLATEASKPTDAEAIPEILPPSGRREVEGRVISTKTTEVGFKMLVEVEADGGKFRLFGTVPSVLADESEPLRGARVRFTAEIKPKERGFGFFSRPTNAQRVATAA